MHNTNGKLARSLTASSLGQHGSQELGRNIILIRSSKTSNPGQILLRTTEPLRTSKTNLVLEDDSGIQSKHRHFFIQQNDVTKGLFVQSVKRLTSETPILLLGGGEGSNGHILIQTTQASGDDSSLNEHSTTEEPSSSDNILVQALEGLSDHEVNASSNICNVKSVSMPIGSGESI
ncbi:hypothetical protein WA026_014876 [Henosepilachna vigintioctopunctata]|uniref:Uncharacterized protein n=1 Tax=Henosepilachna vigintioctopunctata TaxID=420089 RepID=A0AAW1TYI1_9CUCU